MNVWFDKEKMESIFKNIISNALKYTPENGNVQVFVSETSDSWSVEVRDTGIGIPANEQKKLFMIRKLSKTEQEISLTELAEEFQISQRTESDRRVFLLSLVNYNPDAAREDVVQKQIAADEERNALPGKIPL